MIKINAEEKRERFGNHYIPVDGYFNHLDSEQALAVKSSMCFYFCPNDNSQPGKEHMSSFTTEQVTDHIFKLIEYYNEKPNESDLSSQIKRSIYIKHEFVPIVEATDSSIKAGMITPVKLDIKTSFDQKTWTDLTFDYEVFEQKVLEEVNSKISEKKEGTGIPFTWLGDFKIIPITKYTLGWGTMMLFASTKSFVEEWKTLTWKIFDRIADRFWNSHYVDISCTMHGTEQAAVMKIEYTDDSDLRAMHIKNHPSTYQNLLSKALSCLKILKPGQQTLLPCSEKMTWNPGVAEFFIFRAIAEKLKAENAALIRVDGQMYVKKLTQRSDST